MSRRSRDRPGPERGSRHCVGGGTVAHQRTPRWITFRFLGIFAAALTCYFLLTTSIQVREPAELKSRPLVAWLARASDATQESVIRPYQRAIAAAVAATLHLFGYDLHRDGPRIESARFSIEVTHGCDGLELSLLLGAAIVAFPARAGSKVIGLAAGLAAIAACNCLRVLSLWLVGAHWQSAFAFAHFNLWPFLFICFALVLFTAWLRFASAHGQGHVIGGAAAGVG